MSLHNLAHLSTSHFRSTYRVSKLVPIGAHMDPLKYPMSHMQRCWQVTRILSSSSRLREVGSSAAGRLTWSIPSSNVLLEEVLVSVISPGCAGKLEAKNPAKKTVAILSMDANCQMTWVANVFSMFFEKCSMLALSQ